MAKGVVKGTPEQFLHQVENRIAELGGDVAACSKVTAAETYQDVSGIMGEMGDTWTVKELREYWDREQMNDPVLSEYASFDDWLEDTLSQMTPMNDVEDITAAAEDDPTHNDRFIHNLVGDIEDKLATEVDGLTFDTLENALSITVVRDGEVTQFEVPFEDISFNFDKMDNDVAYIANTIRDSLDSFSSGSEVAEAGTELNIESATNTCGIACKPEVLSSVSGDVIHALSWSSLMDELFDRGYEVDSAYRRQPDQWIVAYKDGKSYDIEVTRYSAGDFEVHPDNISEVIEADTDIYNDEDEDVYDDEGLVGFAEIASKSVTDSDGFLTDYTMYRDTSTGEYVFVFGDKDVYGPQDGNFDWSCETEEETWEWFNSYRGFDDDDDGYDDILESEDISPDEDDLLEWFNNASCDVIDAGWTDDGEIIVSLNHPARDVESMAADLSSCIEDNNYHVTDWNTNGGNVFIFTVIHNEDYAALGGLTDEESY